MDVNYTRERIWVKETFSVQNGFRFFDEKFFDKRSGVVNLSDDKNKECNNDFNLTMKFWRTEGFYFRLVN